MNNIPFYVYSTFCLSIHLMIDNLGCIHLLAIVNNTAENVSVQISAWVPVFNSFGHTPRSRIAGSYNNSIFNFLRSHYTSFHSGGTILRSDQQSTRILSSPHPCQNLLFSFCLFVLFCFVFALTILISVKEIFLSFNSFIPT